MRKYFYLIILVAISFPLGVNAWLPVESSGSGASLTAGCNTNKYCWNSPGIRVTLYKQTGATTAEMVGRSHDFWMKGKCFGTSLDPSCNEKPKFVPLTFDVVKSKQDKKEITASDFSINYTTYRSYDETKVHYLNSSIWKDDFFEDNNDFQKWLKEVDKNEAFNKYLSTFDLTAKNLGLDPTEKQDMINNREKYFLVVELMISLWVGPYADTPSGFSKNVNYVGTAYQLMNFWNKHSAVSKAASALYVKNQDFENFIKKDNSGVLRSFPNSTGIEKGHLNSKYTIGMTVYKLTQLLKDCPSDCASSLSCAADYCEGADGVTDSATKRDCIINRCNYKEKHPLSCNSSCPASEKNTNCTQNSRLNSSTVQMNDIKTCKLYEEGLKNYAGEREYYIGVNCTEKNSVTYPNTLPDVLDKVGGGFNYSLKVVGNNTCTFKFNKAKYDFEKKALYGSAMTDPNSEPEKAKRKFTSLTNITGYDIAKYSTDIKATMKVGSKTENLIVDDSKTSTNLEYFKTISTYEKKSKVNGETTIVLQPKCYSIITGNIHTPTLGTNCSDVDGDLLSTNMFGYFTYDLGIGRTTTKIDIDKKRLDNSVWCNLGSDSCYLDIDDSDNDAECYLTVLNSSGNEATPVGGYYNTKVRVKYNAYLNKVDDADYYFNGVWYNSFGNDWELVPLTNYYNVPAVGATPIDKTISGAIKYRDTNGNEVIKNCPVRIKLKPDSTTTGQRCKTNFKPVQYAAIKEYCNTEWDKDDDLYMSAEDCYKKCSIRNRKTCKMTCNKNDMTCVKNYCSNASNLAFDGYKESGDCIQDCGGFTDDGNSEYIYRPIALGLVDGKSPTPGSDTAFRAFPNREAGANWIGYEEKYTSKTAQEIFRESEPIYTIVINKDTIKTIKEYINNNKNKYISYDNYTKETTGYYRSTFIKNHKTDIFTKVCTNVRGCPNV